MVYKFFDKKTSGSSIKNENISNKELAEELNKPIIKKFKKRKVHSPFIDIICVADLADMQLISTFNKQIRFLLVIPLKYKKGIIITDAFQRLLKESNRKANKIWVGKGSKLYNRSMKSWLKNFL